MGVGAVRALRFCYNMMCELPSGKYNWVYVVGGVVLGPAGLCLVLS